VPSELGPADIKQNEKKSNTNFLSNVGGEAEQG